MVSRTTNQQGPAPSERRDALRTLVLAMSGALLPVLFGGCDARPRAPALRDAHVYQNNQEGFRFLVPDNWTQTANAVLPNGSIEGEVLLVQYRMRTADQGASLEVLCFDEEQPSDLQAYHAGPSHGSSAWQSGEPPHRIEVGGASVERWVYIAEISKQKLTKEVVAFRRGPRVYSFIGLFWSTDNKAREQLRRAVSSILWRS